MRQPVFMFKTARDNRFKVAHYGENGASKTLCGRTGTWHFAAKCPAWLRVCAKCAVVAAPLTVDHGKLSGYTRGCRCAKCRQAMAEYQRSRRHRVHSGAVTSALVAAAISRTLGAGATTESTRDSSS